MNEKKRQKFLRRLHAAVMAEMDEKYDLIYVHYDQKLTEEQVNNLVRDDWEEFWEGLWEWESDARYDGAKYELEELAKGIINRLEREHDVHLDGLYDEYEHSDEWDEARYQMDERESGEWVRQIVSNTGSVLLRIPISNDHETPDGWTMPAAIPDREWFLAVHGIDPSPENVEALRSIEAECGERDALWPFLLAYVDVSDLYDAIGDERITHVDITDPHLLLEDVYNGSGMDAKLTGSVRVPKTSLRTDEDAAGHSWDSVCGPVKSAYTVEFQPVRATEEVAA